MMIEESKLVENPYPSSQEIQNFGDGKTDDKI